MHLSQIFCRFIVSGYCCYHLFLTLFSFVWLFCSFFKNIILYFRCTDSPFQLFVIQVKNNCIVKACLIKCFDRNEFYFIFLCCCCSLLFRNVYALPFAMLSMSSLSFKMLDSIWLWWEFEFQCFVSEKRFNSLSFLCLRFFFVLFCCSVIKLNQNEKMLILKFNSHLVGFFMLHTVFFRVRVRVCMFYLCLHRNRIKI